MLTAMTAADRKQWQLLRSPLGEPQSGRVRYAAAMYLYNRGLIGEDLLEAFRVCAKRDDEYPEMLKPELKGQK